MARDLLVVQYTADRDELGIFEALSSIKYVDSEGSILFLLYLRHWTCIGERTPKRREKSAMEDDPPRGSIVNDIITVGPVVYFLGHYYVFDDGASIMHCHLNICIIVGPRSEGT